MPSTVFVEMLCGADRQLRGLHWTCPTPQAAVLQPWLADEALKALAASVPCYATLDTQGWDGALQTTLAGSGLRVQAPPCVPRAIGAPWPADAKCVSGDWYTGPPAKPNVAQAASRQRALQLLQLVSDDNVETREIEDMFRRDAALSYQLLRLVNSASMGLRREITSFGQAIAMLGRSQLKRWLNLLVFAARDDDERGALLMAHAGLRARAMELWAQALGHDKADQEQAFMAGMFSMLGVLFGTPLVDMLVTIRVSDELRAALVERQGVLGNLLTFWEAVEHRDAAAVDAWLQTHGQPPATHNTVLLQACAWMLELTRDQSKAQTR